MFHRARAARVDGIEIHFHVIEDVAADHRTLQEMDVVQLVGDAGGIVQILHSGIAVFLPVDVHNMNRSPRGAIVHPRPGEIEIVLAIAAV